MVNSRKKGVRFELVLLNELRMYFPSILTSRNASKHTDDLKVDFINTEPYAFQAKHAQRTPSYASLLKEMRENFKKLTPVIIHRRNREQDVAVLTKYDFYLLLQHLQELEKFKEDYQDIVNDYENQ